MRNTLQSINDRVINDPEGFIAEQERAYMEEIAAIARRIAADADIKIAAIAGPSASGKTTTAHILRDMLEREGERVAVVSLDDFYLSSEDLPVLPSGKRDTESPNALDKSALKECFSQIIKCGSAVLPRYDFASGKSIPRSREIDIGSRGIVIVEGLHALNPVISDLVPRKNIFKLYISVNSPILLSDGTVLLSSRQIRLARRTLRDEVFRGSPVNNTLALWEGVVAGERKYLYLFKETADVFVRTLHLYELGLYKERFCALSHEVAPSAPCRDYFMRTAAALSRFEAIDPSLVPESSLIREFIGREGL